MIPFFVVCIEVDAGYFSQNIMQTPRIKIN